MQFCTLVCVWKSENVCIMKAKNEINICDPGSSFQSLSAHRPSVPEMVVTSSPINIWGFCETMQQNFMHKSLW